MVKFVNPYSFVPVVPARRGEAAGHAELSPQRFSGRLRTRITARTPLLLKDCVVGPDPGRVVNDIPRVDGKAIIPGSSLAGAVRSLHEAFVGGCMRVSIPTIDQCIGSRRIRF